VQSALTNDMGALIYLEARLQSDSGNINYTGFKADVSSNAYVDFISGKTSMETAAQAIAADIGQTIATGQLSAAEVAQLQGVLAGLTGDAGLAAKFVGQMTAGADAGVGDTNGYVNRLNSQMSNIPEKTSVDYPFDASGRLKPDVTYRSGEFGYNYETDGLRRITNFNAEELQITGRDKRLRHNRNTPGKLEGDHAAHLAGDLFGGSPKLDNLVSQLSDVNLSQYRKIENIWAKAIREGKKVSVNVDIIYEGDSLRPTRFIIEYMIDGAKYTKFIDN